MLNTENRLYLRDLELDPEALRLVSYLFILSSKDWVTVCVTPISAYGICLNFDGFKLLNYFRSLKEWLVSDEEVKLIGVVLCPCIAYLLPPSIYICPG